MFPRVFNFHKNLKLAVYILLSSYPRTSCSKSGTTVFCTHSCSWSQHSQTSSTLVRQNQILLHCELQPVTCVLLCDLQKNRIGDRCSVLLIAATLHPPHAEAASSASEGFAALASPQATLCYQLVCCQEPVARCPGCSMGHLQLLWADVHSQAVPTSVLRCGICY